MPEFEKHAFKMKLFPGMEAEYRKRHDEIWPELSQALRDAGIYDYAIFLDEEITSWMLMCAAVIVCGVALSTGLVKLGRRKEPVPAP